MYQSCDSKHLILNTVYNSLVVLSGILPYRIPVFIFLMILIFKIPQYHLKNVRNATLLERGLFYWFTVALVERDETE